MALFDVGTIDITASAAAALAAVAIPPDVFLARHQAGDWGEVDDREQRANAFAVQQGHTMYAITSRYPLPTGASLLVMTAPDRSATRLLLTTEHEVYHVSSQEGYALWATTYDHERNALIAVEAQYVEALMAQLPILSAIDVGTGTGRHAVRLARQGVTVSAVDASPAMLAIAQQAAQRAGVTIDFRCAAIEDDLPYPTNQFDFLLCALTLCHVPSLPQALQECARVVRPGGAVLITDIHPEVVSMGWKATLRRPGVTYVLPYPGHTREDYLTAVITAGLTIHTVIEVLVRDIPTGYIIDPLRHEFGDKQYCLIVLAHKPA